MKKIEIKNKVQVKLLKKKQVLCLSIYYLKLLIDYKTNSYDSQKTLT